MRTRLTDPRLLLTFEGNDLEPGHSTEQTIGSDFILNRSYSGKLQRLNGLKSSSDQIGLQIARRCPSTEDVVATQGNVRAVLMDGEDTVFTGYVSTNYEWRVNAHGEQMLSIMLESVGTRLLNRPFIETGKHFFRCSASAAIWTISSSVGIRIHSGDERKLLMEVARNVDAGETCRELLDSLLYECNAVYWFDNIGELRIDLIDPQTTGAPEILSDELCVVGSEAVSLSKSIRTYKGARVTYDEISTADDYLVYRNTTGQDADHEYCLLELQPGEHFDGTEIYTAQEWSEATADEFREPALIGAVNAASESQIVGSNQIINIDNLSPVTQQTDGLTATFENVGGGYFKLDATNSGQTYGAFTRMDLYASIVYIKAHGVIRTQIDGSSAGKTLLEEDLKWIHDKDNATRHANLLNQYHQYAGSKYTFRTQREITLGSVVRLHEDLFSGLDVYVLVTSCDITSGSDVLKYSGVAITTFDLAESAYHGTTQPANQSGAQGPAGEPGKAAEVQYAIGDSIVSPPVDEMLWNAVPMTWDSETMLWQQGMWTEDIPDMERGRYVWMRTRVGDQPWQYTRLTGSNSWDAEGLGVATTACPTQSREGLGLIPGDFFIAGATFTDPVDGNEYRKGFAYEYNGTAWTVLDLSLTQNASKGLQCLGDLMASGINVTDSTASIYGWFQNLVAQNGVFENLLARNLQVGPGDGTEGSGFRFRAKEEQGVPVFDVMYGESSLFNVDIQTGKIFFGQGFWYDPEDGAIHSTNDNVVIGEGGDINIKNGLYQSNLLCPSFRSMPKNPPATPTYLNLSGSGADQFYTMFSYNHSDLGVLIPCLHSQEASVRYLVISHTGTYRYSYQFKDANGNDVGLIWGDYYSSTHYTGMSPWVNTSFTLTVGSTTDVAFQLLNMDGTQLSIGTLSADTRKGELYYVLDSGGTTGTLHIKL